MNSPQAVRRGGAWRAAISLLAALLGLSSCTGNSSPPASVAAKSPQAQVAALQTQIRESKELHAEFTTTAWYQKMGPIRAQWRKPDFFLIDAAAWGDNCREVYWFRNSELVIYEDWPKRGERGVRVTNLVELLEGNTERAYDEASKRMPDFMAAAGIGVRLMQFVGSAPADQLTIRETQGALRVSVGLQALGAAAQGFQPLDNVKTTFVFEIPAAEQQSPAIRRAWIEHEGTPVEAGISVEFSKLEFQLAPKDHSPPDLPLEILTPIRLTELSELTVSLIPLPLRRRADRPGPPER